MVSRFLTGIAISIAALLIAMIAAITAVAFFAYALHLFLLERMPPAGAAALTGVLVLVFAILLIIVVRAVFGRRRKGKGPLPLEAYENAAEIGSDLGKKLRMLAQAHASSGLLAALLAGFVLGASPKLRAFLKSILKN